jgi:predicted nucleic acid-binding Zn ribbon protein
MNARKTNDQPLADVLKQMVHVFRLKSNLYRTKIENLWELKMGRTIATYTRDIRMKDNVLYVTIESASLRAELQFGREKIKTIMNEEIGEEYIKEVVIN